jgi:type I restriction enzyme S subunit
MYIQAIVRRWSQGIEVRPPLLGKQIKTKNLQVIRAGDFLISDIQASYGAMCIVGDQQDGLYVSNVYSILIPRNENQIHTRYFDQLSRTSLMRHLVAQSSNGFKAERIRLSFVLETFMQQKVFLPDDVAEQRRIADLLQLCDDEITLLERKLALLKKQKQGLMQQLLTGKVRVKT